MTRTTASLLRILALAPLAAGLFACKAFDLGAQTEAAQAANEAQPGYPRLAEIPPQPADIECIRAGISDSLIVTDPAPETVPGSPFGADGSGAFNAGQQSYQVLVHPAAPAPEARYRNLVSVAGTLAGDVLGEDGDAAAAPGSQLVDCPPGPGIMAGQLTGERDRLQAAAAAIRAQSPVAPAPVVLPPGMTTPVAVSPPVRPGPRP